MVQENPCREESVRVEFADWPALSVRKVLLAEKVKSGPVTLSGRKTLWLRLVVLVPVTSTYANPGGVFEGTVTVRVVLASTPGVRLMKLFVSDADIVPEKLVERLIGPVKPRMLVSVMVDWPVWPCFIVWEAGVALMMKSGGTTATSSWAWWLIDPLVPFTVMM